MTDAFSVAAEPTRRRLLQLLASGPRTVNDLAAHFPVTRSAISQHLGALAEVGLVTNRKEGRQRFYSVRPQGMAELRAEIDKFWTTELDRLVEDAAALAARRGPIHRGTAMSTENASADNASAEKTALLPVSVEEAFALITEPDRLRRWMTVSARVDLRAGGEYRWTVVPGHIVAGTFREIEPGRRIVFGFGWEGSADPEPDGSTVTITFEPTDGGTLVRLVHDGLTDDQAASHLEGWNHFFARLERVAAGGDAGLSPMTAKPRCWTS